MPDLLNVLLKLHNILALHAIHDEHGEGSRSEILHHNILPLHGLDILRKICQNIIIHSGIHIPQHRRNQQQYTDDQYRYPKLYHLFPKLNHNHLLLFSFTTFMTIGHFLQYALYYKND